MLLIIDNYDSFTYNLYQLCAQLIDPIQIIRNDRMSVADIARLNPSKILISPGPKDPQQAGICLDLIRTLAPFVPILGVCLGMQAIGEAFGAKIIQSPQPFHGKTSLIHHLQQGLYKGIPSPFVAGRYHSLIIEEETMPSCFIKQAETEAGLIMGIKHCLYPCFGVQFHPESILTPDGFKLLINFIHMT